MNEFLAMGGHGGYVWSAYGITLLVLILNGWMARRKFRSAVRAAIQHREPVVEGRQPQVRQL